VHLGGESEGVDLPVAIAADKSDGQIDELRIYHGTWQLTGRRARRPPLLQPDPELRAPDVLAQYQSALAAGDLDAIHRGREGLSKFYEWSFSNGGGIPLEHCALTDDERACALEYNVVRWGRTELPPEPGIAVYVRGESGKLAAARIYDDLDPPVGPPT
jgi:hypothetical protein